jgi:seryl-tRNA synthetase
MMEAKIPTKEGELIKEGPKMRTNGAIEGIDELLFKEEIIGEFVKGSGQNVILPKGTRILNGIYSVLNQYLKEAIGFEEVVLPKIAPVDTFRKAGILGKWDDYLESVKPFGKTNGIAEEYLMDPLQCTIFYQFLEGKVVDVSNGPIRVYDRSGPTYRNEDLDKIKPLVKQREFHRSEFVYVGTKEQVIETREKCISQMEKLCEDLRLRYRIVVGTGCFQLDNGEIKMPETAEEIPIKDLEIFCHGYKNPTDGSSYLEVVGSSVLADMQTSRFNIKSKDGKELWSGCTGIGLDRLMYALITNYGTNVDINNVLRQPK